VTTRLPHLLVVGLFLLLATAVRSEEVLPTTAPAEVGLSAEKLGRIVPAVEKLVADGRIAGAVTVVARRGKVAHFEATGYMDLAGKRAMRKDTIFRIYSMSKPVTAAAALILCDEGKLELDAPVSNYLPSFEGLTVLVDGEEVAPSRAMTVRDLMRHTSGLTYGFFGRSAVDRRYMKERVLDDRGTLADMVAKLSRIPLLSHPGETWRYSISIDVLGRVVEVVSKKTSRSFCAHASSSRSAWWTPDSTCPGRSWIDSPRTTDRGGRGCVSWTTPSGVATAGRRRFTPAVGGWSRLLRTIYVSRRCC
jgi:CubicO group peptidase (beta-lactamase class C family)